MQTDLPRHQPDCEEAKEFERVARNRDVKREVRSIVHDGAIGECMRHTSWTKA
jgi:hypothetical protein